MKIAIFTKLAGPFLSSSKSLRKVLLESKSSRRIEHAGKVLK